MSRLPPTFTRSLAAVAIGLAVSFAGVGCEERPEVEPPSESETEEQIKEHIPRSTVTENADDETMAPVEPEPGEE